MVYACKAETKGRGRCRNWALNENGFCSFHQRLKEEGKEVKLAQKPDIVLVRFSINPKRSSRLEVFGIPKKGPLSIQKDWSHQDQAQKLGRQPFRYRQIPDSGVPVFGREGLQDVSIYRLLTEELPQLYEISDIHLRPRKDEKMDILTITFIDIHQESAPFAVSEAAFKEISDFLGASCWGYCHIWANPPNEQGKIVHTLNASHRLPEKKPKQILIFDDGFWRAEVLEARTEAKI